MAILSTGYGNSLLVINQMTHFLLKKKFTLDRYVGLILTPLLSSFMIDHINNMHKKV